MRKFLYFLAAILLFSITADAQRNLGIATSDWMATNSLYLNPANIADSREKFIIDIFSIGAGVDNNLGRIGTIGSLFGAINGGNTNNIFNYTNNNAFSLLAPYAQIHGPGFMYKINKRHSLALTTGINVFNQFNNFDKSLFRTLSDPTYTYAGSANGDINLTSKNFNYTAQIWSQVGLTYGVVLLDDRKNKLKAGVTLRYLGGIGYVGLKGNNLDAHYKGGNDSLYVDHSDLEFASNELSTKGAIVNGFSSSNVLNDFFGRKGGSGVGGDIGVVYEYAPYPGMTGYNISGKATDIRYKLRLSGSITDIGAITYKSNNNSNAEVTGNGSITSAGLANINTFDQFRTYAVKQGFTADTTSATTKVHLPTSLLLSADYYIARCFYVNATFAGNLANRQNFGNSYYNQFTVTLRYDTRLLTVGLPISYSVLDKNIKMGLGFRLSGFFIGSDDMLALFANHQYGFNIYMGGSVPIYRKERNRNRSSDSTDLNPEPDMEHGGRVDSTDNCPDLFFNDYLIKDPEQAEHAISKTDTDSDGDGIPDSEDACPTVAGPASNHGCPLPKEPSKKTVNFSTTTIQLQTGKSAFNKESYTLLDQLTTVLKEYPSYNLMIEGHTDNTGNAMKNLELSKARAETVKNYLLSKGIASTRIKVKGLGAAQPVAGNETAAGRAKNRRVVMKLEKK